jgi:hypothetical protein
MLSDLIYFLKYPKFNDIPVSLNFKMSVLLITRSILLYIGVLVLSTLLFFPLLKMLNLMPNFGINHSDTPLSFRVLILIPLFEETIFRLPLKFSKQNFFLFLAGFNFLIFYHTYDTRIVGIFSCIIAIIPYLKLISESVYLKMEFIWEKHFFLLYYSFAIFFGLFHMSNFVNLTFAHFLLSPLIVFNQIAMGLILGYVRVTYLNGFILGVIIHILINLPFILIPHL